MTMSVRRKFQSVDKQSRQSIMEEYLAGGITQKELGRKHNFHHRQLRKWFADADKLEEYQVISQKNISRSSTKPMTEKSKYKISGFNSIQWKGKKLGIKHGLIGGILIPAPDHPAANAQGYIFEHRLVAELVLGRYLTKDEVVHHIDLDATNNHESNLVVLSWNEHGRLHALLQFALVQLMKSEDLQQLTQYLVDRIRNDKDWKPFGNSNTNGKRRKRQIVKEQGAGEV